MDMGFLSLILDPVIAAGPLFMILIVFTVIGLLLRMGVLNAIKNGMLIAAGFGGVYIVVDYFLAHITPAAQALAEMFGGVFSYTDVGWAASAAYAFASPWAYVVIVIMLGVNLLMIFTKMTDTLNLNIWDYWEPIFAVLVLQLLTGNIVLGLVFAAVLQWFILMATDFNAQRGYCKDLGFEGLAFYQGGTAVWGPVGHYIAKVLDKIGLKEAKFTPEYIQDKFGVVGEPAVLGSIIGLLMGVAARFYWVDIILLMIALATSLVLIPMMSGIVMQALVPVSEAAASFMKKSAGKSGRQLFIGVDPAIAVGNTTVLATTILMVPIMLVLAFIIPGALVIPLADLPSLLFIWVYLVAPNKFDIVRTVITATIVGVFAIVLGSHSAAAATLVATSNGLEVAAGTGVTSMLVALSPEINLATFFGNNFEALGVAGFAAILAVGVLVTGYFRLRYLKKLKAVA
jgi:PTS system galactitol-specific IIC component